MAEPRLPKRLGGDGMEPDHRHQTLQAMMKRKPRSDSLAYSQSIEVPWYREELDAFTEKRS